jgi:hypothetical protein
VSHGPGTGYRRRAFHWLVAGGLVFVGLTVLLLVARPRPVAYVPGKEQETSAEITRGLERAAPPLADNATPESAQAGAGPSTAPGRGSPGTERRRVTFSDQAEAAGLRFRHFFGKRSSQLPEDMGSGLAWGDYDGDGRPDLFVVNEAGPLTMTPAEVERSPAHAHLFHNNGDGTFTDVTERAGLAVRGWGMGAAWGDYDGDGKLDLFVTRYGTNLLFHNNGDGTFTDVSEAAGVGGVEGFWTGASWADYDRDGHLDLYVCGYVRYRFDPAIVGQTSLQFRSVVPFTLNPSSYPPERNLLYHNNGNGTFTEVAREAGVDNPTGRSLSASWADFDGDGWPDLYVANDVSENAMFHNLGNGRFRDISHSAWVADYRGAMGLGIGDFDNHGALDIFITHWIAQQNALFVNETARMKVTPEAPLRFVDQADLLGLGQISRDVIGWGTGFFDFDNDGRLDLFAANGSTFQEEADPTRLIAMRNFLFWNAGETGFYEVGKTSGAPFAVANVGRGASFADYDGDGDLDIALVVHGGPLRLLRNEGGNARAWLRVILRSPRSTQEGPYRSTSYATGALVRLTTKGGQQMREVGGQSSYLSQEPPGEVFFGLGDAETVDRLEIRWPSGRTQSFEGLPGRAAVRIKEGEQPHVEPARR